MLLAQRILARLLHVPRHAAQQKIPPLRQRRHERHRPHAPALLRREQHARVARMHREPQHLPPHRRDRLPLPGQRAQIHQQIFRPHEPHRIRFLQPRKIHHVVDPARLERQHDLRQIQPLHLGQFLRRAVRVLALGPQPHAHARGRAPRAPRPLLRARHRNLLDHQRVDPAVRIEPRHPRQPAVDHRRHPVDRQRRLRHVRRHDDFPRLIARHRPVLLLRRQLAVQRITHKIPQPPRGLDRLHRAVDLIGPRHEHQHVAPRRRVRHALALRRRHVPHRVVFEIHRLRQILDPHRITPPLRHQHVARREITFQHPRIERRRHHHDLQVGPRRLLDLHRARQRDIPVEVPLVKLVEHDRADPAQRRIERHLPQQNPLRHKPDPRPLAHPRLQPDLVAHHLAQIRADLLRHPLRQHARRQPPRLQHHDLPFPRPPAQRIQQPVTQQHLRQLRRFARPRRRLHDQPPLRAQRGDDGGLEFVDGQFARRRHFGQLKVEI